MAIGSVRTRSTSSSDTMAPYVPARSLSKQGYRDVCDSSEMIADSLWMAEASPEWERRLGRREDPQRRVLSFGSADAKLTCSSTTPFSAMSSSRFRPPPPKQTADGWDDEIVSADMTLKLSDLLPPSETSLPWIGDVDLACELLSGDSLTAQGELEGNFFHEPVLNPTKHIRVATSSSSKRPSARSEERAGSREGKRSRTSTSQHHQSTTPADQLPTPSPEPASTHLHPQSSSHRSHRSREPSSSSASLIGAAPSSGRTNNNTTSASTRPTTVPPTEPASVVVPPVEEPSSSTLSVLSWREQTHEGAGPDESHGGGGGGHELDLAASSTSDPSPPEQPSSATQSRLSTRPQTSHRSRSPSNSAVARSREPTASSSSRPAPSLHRRPSSVHSTTSVTLNTFKTSSIIQPQPRSTNALNRSTSSSSSVAGPSRSYIADEPAKDDFYERKKRDSYIGQHSVLLPEEEEISPASSPRVRTQRVEGAKDKRRVGGTVIGGKRIEVRCFSAQPLRLGLRRADMGFYLSCCRRNLLIVGTSRRPGRQRSCRSRRSSASSLPTRLTPCQPRREASRRWISSEASCRRSIRRRSVLSRSDLYPREPGPELTGLSSVCHCRLPRLQYLRTEQSRQSKRLARQRPVTY